MANGRAYGGMIKTAGKTFLCVFIKKWHIMKYIDADKLKKLIDEKWKELADKGVKDGGGKYEIEIYTYLSVLRLIDSFQQEQPEVDLEKEVEEFCLEYDSRKEVWFDMTPSDKKMLSTPTWSNFASNIARHFYELGLNAKNEE